MFMGAKVNVYGSKGACIWERETAKVNVYGSESACIWGRETAKVNVYGMHAISEIFRDVTTFNSYTAIYAMRSLAHNKKYGDAENGTTPSCYSGWP
jgi:hypothetical protein